MFEGTVENMLAVPIVHRKQTVDLEARARFTNRLCRLKPTRASTSKEASRKLWYT